MRLVGSGVFGRDKAEPLGVPWFRVAAWWQGGVLAVTCMAIVQRGAQPLMWMLLVGLLVVFPSLYFFATGGRIPLMVASPPLLAATAILVWTHHVTYDAAPFIVVFAMQAVAIENSVMVCVAAAVVFAAFFTVASITHHLDGVVFYYVGQLGAVLVRGRLMAVDQRLMIAEHQARESLRTHTIGERRRIAREIHDVVAHTLSVTMLHLTGARRELQQGGDVAEAVSALLEAEQLGRHAMGDIRRTIGVLRTSSTIADPEPGLDDIVGLIRDFQAGGLQVDYRIDGEHGAVSPSAGLAVYRICQESLANVVKHAPQAKADMALRISPSSIVVSISNDLPRPQPGAVCDPYGGAGLRGMTQRAELLGGRLSAGPVLSRWSVHAQIPLSTDTSESEMHPFVTL